MWIWGTQVVVVEVSKSRLEQLEVRNNGVACCLCDGAASKRVVSPNPRRCQFHCTVEGESTEVSGSPCSRATLPVSPVRG